jgi:hypothetical protein
MGPVTEELTLVLDSEVVVDNSDELLLLLLLKELDVGSDVVELEDELVTGTVVDAVLPGDAVDVEESSVLVTETLVLVTAVADEAAAAIHEQTFAAEFRAERAVKSPQALVAHGRAATTIADEIDAIH